MEQPTSRTCAICKTEIPKNSFVSRDCGCIIHLACNKLYSNVTSQCPNCFPLNISVLGNLDTKAIKQNPISFGDDDTVDLIISKRVELLSGMEKIKPNDYVSLDTLRQSLQYNSKPIGSAIGTFKGALAYVMENATADDTLRSKIDQMSILECITNRMPVIWLRSKGVDGKSLYSNNVTMDILFKCGYVLEDFVILRITWNDMLNMGFRNYEMFKSIKPLIDVRYLCNVWSLNYENILRGVCGNNMKKFAKLEFNKNELKLLQFSFDVFNKMTKKKKTLTQFNKLTFLDWKELGLNQILLDEYKYSSSEIIECFKVTRESFKTGLGINLDYFDSNQNQVVVHERNNIYANNIDPYWELDDSTRDFSIGEDD